MSRILVTRKCVCGNILKPKQVKFCSGTCQRRFRVFKRPKGLKYTLNKVNPTSFKKGQTPWNKGTLSQDFNGKTVDALHEWVYRVLGSPKECEFCGGNENLEWSNKSGTYMRDITDWQRLCKKCHGRYDFEKFGARRVFYT